MFWIWAQKGGEEEGREVTSLKQDTLENVISYIAKKFIKKS